MVCFHVLAGDRLLRAILGGAVWGDVDLCDRLDIASRQNANLASLGKTNPTVINLVNGGSNCRLCEKFSQKPGQNLDLIYIRPLARVSLYLLGNLSIFTAGDFKKNSKIRH